MTPLRKRTLGPDHNSHAAPYNPAIASPPLVKHRRKSPLMPSVNDGMGAVDGSDDLWMHALRKRAPFTA
jgi:hypothetical protein